MNKKVKVDNLEYEIIEDYKDGFVINEFVSKCTDYFYGFDYVVGDWAYDKLRLKGFYDDNNKKSTQNNRISNLDKYIKEKCAYGCKYFVAKRVNL